MAEISTERMRELINEAKQAARLSDFSPCGAGLPPHFGFSEEVYKTMLEMLVRLEQEKCSAS